MREGWGLGAGLGHEGIVELDKLLFGPLNYAGCVKWGVVRFVEELWLSHDFTLSIMSMNNSSELPFNFLPHYFK